MVRAVVGEVVTYYVTDEITCLAVVVNVIFWDLADLELATGEIIRARRVVVEDEDGARRGRFAAR